MTRHKLTWFGFGLNQKQAVWIFVIAVIGICIISFILFGMIYSIVMNFIYYDPYYMPGEYFRMIILSMLPFLIFLIIMLILDIYTIVKCRQIAVYYSKDLYNREPIPQVDKILVKTGNPPIKLTPIYCPNCGKKISKKTRFCMNCGADISYL